MPTLTILTTEEQAEFESPPNFIDAQRRTFFILSDEVQQVLRRLQGKTKQSLFSDTACLF